jgi:DNA-binding NtrC family response regulator
MKGHHLGSEERRFFTLVSRAVFTNPFTDERAALDMEITGLPPSVPESKRTEILTGKLGQYIQRLDVEKRADIRGYSGEDRRLLETSLLFEFFHRFLDRFDRFILDQIKAGSRPLAVPFARRAFSYLDKKGFATLEMCRYFEVVFQLRRAYFFIDSSLVGRSACMKALRRQLWNDVFTHDLALYNRCLWDRMEDFSTLILGETGTGKGTAAAAIGRSGFIPYDEKNRCFVESFTRSFVSLNLSQYPENLIESELFGHRRGAFTGAVDDYQGIFDRCSPHGAIFLDEIGEVSIPVQIKLLRVLQDRVFLPVGSHREHRFLGRVIAATNRPIETLRREGRMRDDFYYRLCSDIITVPPLRQRIAEDPAELDDLIALLVERMLGSRMPDIMQMVCETVTRDLGKGYPWPGNVRELEQCVRGILLNRHYRGTPSESATPDLVPELIAGIEDGRIKAQRLLAGYCFLLYRRCGTYEAAARRCGLDRRTVRKYVDQWLQTAPG